ncbi:nitrate- and nitrite sensing domain-containing protein [Nocardiopsis sp. HNM0947]|uniref:histidine kinase n=1 Tax=Nocardiopsis coralli TaxID=2772213 RepID=A0ABR9PEF8_9ACTN|nr:nitrate- and nitrite sensing domain-containing protein [Nocardiopsis coralli]MBE3002211.1 nitrate- and nitrite sensing domain-containing protein [Nocardiopsis coralli]
MRKKGDGASTIRGQLNRIVLVPSLCFLALWLVVAAVGTVQAVQLMGAVNQARDGAEVFSRAAEELRMERRQALVQLGAVESGDQDTVDTAALEESRTATDGALEEAVGASAELGSGWDGEVDRIAADLQEAPDSVAELRRGVDEAIPDREHVLLEYGEVLDLLQETVTALVHTTDGGENLSDAVLASDLMNARSEYSEADALLAGVIAAGGMNHQESAHFTYLTASYRDTLEEAGPSLHTEVRNRYEEMVDGRAWGRAEELSRDVVTRPLLVESETGAVTTTGEPVLEPNTGIDVSTADWEGSSAPALEELDALAAAQTGRTIDLAWSAALLRVSLGMAAGAAVLAAGVVAIAVVGRSSRRLTGRLARLRGQILDRDDDLPEIIDRAQRGDRVEVQDELPPLDECGEDEIGQVAEAFDSAQLAAVEAAVRQAEIRRGANRAFLGVAFRNQALVQRQLRLLDEIEHDEQDPRALQRLFQLDHLATRGRRYADNLIILGGGQANRRRSRPRPLVDVLRAAIAETEDYGRVRLTSAPRILMHGQVVADVVHLLAELVENATQFSPADSPVDVSCSPVVGGLVVEVEDRGLGMSEQGYARAERTLARPPEFDVLAMPDDPRLGLFVVSRLAERHGIQVWLRPSPYGGTRATALIPESVLEPAESPTPVSGTPVTPPGGQWKELDTPAPSGEQNALPRRSPRVPAGLGSPEAVRNPAGTGPQQPLPAHTQNTPDPRPDQGPGRPPASGQGPPPLPARNPRAQRPAPSPAPPPVQPPTGPPAERSTTPPGGHPVTPPTGQPTADWNSGPLPGVPHWNDPSQPAGPLEPMDPATPRDGFGVQDPQHPRDPRPSSGPQPTVPGHQGDRRER